MKLNSKISDKGLLVLIWLLLAASGGCSKKDDQVQDPDYIWDIDKKGIPQFVNTNYIELAKIGSISKFRSSVGHDYSDSYEHCRSLKHYFQPKGNADWTTVKIWAPVSGTITRAEQEWAGTKIEIESDKYPAFRFSIFHINLQSPRQAGDKVTEGELLGTHIGAETYSDISAIVNDPARQGRMISFFDVITDNLFTQFTTRGINTRADVIIPSSLRDANPLTCNGDTFTSSDPLEGWFVLN